MKQFDLKAFRKDNGLTQKQMADLFSCNQNFISRIESNIRPIPGDKLDILQTRFGDLSTYFFEEDEPQITPPQTDLQSDLKGRDFTIPVVPLSAVGMSLRDFLQSDLAKYCERLSSPIEAAELAMTVRGDSMMPEYVAGSKVLLKEIDPNVFIEWGMTYVIDTPNGVLLKKLMPSEKKDAVCCVSFNPMYQPFDLARSSIHSIYRVLALLTMK